MNVSLHDKTGKKSTKKVKLEPSVFEADVKEDILNLAVFVYLSNQRQSNAHAKDRSEVRGGGRKPWKQKGTGRARHGSSRSPIWRGGGVTFGPRNEASYQKSINKKVGKEAIRYAFSKKNLGKEVLVIEDFDVEKTKDVQKVLRNLGIEGKIFFIQVEEKGLNKAARNIPRINVSRVGELNTYDILNGGNIVIFKSALDEISKLWSKREKSATKKVTTNSKKLEK